MNIDSQDYIVCYDNVGIFSAPRAAWMLRYFGAKNVRVLNGGMKKWKAEGRTTASGAQILPFAITVVHDPFFVVDPNKAVTEINKVH